MFRSYRRKSDIAELSAVRNAGQLVPVEFAVAFRTEPSLVMAPVASIRVFPGLYRMDLPKVGPVGFRLIVRSEIRSMKIALDTAAGMTIEAIGQLMAVPAVIRFLVGIKSVLLGPS